ncbi:MAG: hypothetical protein RLY23_12 [Actinomycetota bacterium]
MKSLRISIISITALLIAAAPAGASPLVLAEAMPWHYWIAPVLFLSFFGIAALLGVSYYFKVVRLKTRGR